MTPYLAHCICFPKKQFCSPSICSFFCDLIVALPRPIISFRVFLGPPSKGSAYAKGCTLRLLSCLFQSSLHLHPYIWKKSLKLIKTAYALGRTAKECCKAHPSQRLYVPDIQCCPHDKLGFDFACHCTEMNSLFNWFPSKKVYTEMLPLRFICRVVVWFHERLELCYCIPLKGLKNDGMSENNTGCYSFVSTISVASSRMQQKAVMHDEALIFQSQLLGTACKKSQPKCNIKEERG